MKCKQCDWCLRNVGHVNLWSNFILGIIKLLGSILSGSKALLADAIHSFADIWISLALFLTLKVSTKEPDCKYPYGRGNVEYICSVFIGVSLLGVAFSICVVSLLAIIRGENPVIGVIGIPVEIVCILGNEILARHSYCIAEEVRSPALFANARENRADALTSIAALIGVVGARLGLYFLDPVAAIFVGVIVGKFAYSSFIEGIHGLLGRSIEQDQLDSLKSLAASIDGVKQIYSIKARRIGQKAGVDIEIGVDPDIQLEDGIRISDSVKTSILQHADYVGDVNIYIK